MKTGCPWLQDSLSDDFVDEVVPMLNWLLNPETPSFPGRARCFLVKGRKGEQIIASLGMPGEVMTLQIFCNFILVVDMGKGHHLQRFLPHIKEAPAPHCWSRLSAFADFHPTADDLKGIDGFVKFVILTLIA